MIPGDGAIDQGGLETRELGRIRGDEFQLEEEESRRCDEGRWG